MSQRVQNELNTEILKRRADLEEFSLVASAELNNLGIDSLTVVDLILTFAERSGADLETALDGLEPPHTLGQLAEVLDRFVETT
tara:strand:- start:2478 stop:2729 length:252 start_codon:yes stop_codon:yes gene_type:complete